MLFVPGSVWDQSFCEGSGEQTGPCVDTAQQRAVWDAGLCLCGASTNAHLVQRLSLGLEVHCVDLTGQSPDWPY
jgi:hypothetical protein